MKHSKKINYKNKIEKRIKYTRKIQDKIEKKHSQYNLSGGVYKKAKKWKEVEKGLKKYSSGKKYNPVMLSKPIVKGYEYLYGKLDPDGNVAGNKVDKLEMIKLRAEQKASKNKYNKNKEPYSPGLWSVGAGVKLRKAKNDAKVKMDRRIHALDNMLKQLIRANAVSSSSGSSSSSSSAYSSSSSSSSDSSSSSSESSGSWSLSL